MWSEPQEENVAKAMRLIAETIVLNDVPTSSAIGAMIALCADQFERNGTYKDWCYFCEMSKKGYKHLWND